jgi:hypothetical protein
MKITIQDHTGDTTLEVLSDTEVDDIFGKLVHEGYLAYTDTKLDEAQDVKSPAEARERGATEIFFTHPVVGG